DSLNRFYDGDPARQASLRAFAIARLAPVLERIGWIAKPGEPDPVKNLRNNLIHSLSALGDPKVIAEARRRYAAQSSDPSAVPAALRKAIISVVSRHADAATWEQLHAAALAEKTPLIKDDLYAYLSSTEDATLAQRALDLSLTDEPGATNSAAMIGNVADLHPELAFEFAVAHKAQVDAKVDSTSRSSYYPELAYNSLDPAMIGKVKAFAEAHIAATARRAANTTVSNITYRIMVHNERLPTIDAWLKKESE
ncbi:MAG TPA: ERAP1-like C-terminal domain-containing protein, partial [Xanthomonadaceae bacterium]|nr:ERAP1-like C-terminal domain-containing protein [Xanthomonadaceae bacterium]